jgi:hypothetical protein
MWPFWSGELPDQHHGLASEAPQKLPGDPVTRIHNHRTRGPSGPFVIQGDDHDQENSETKQTSQISKAVQSRQTREPGQTCEKEQTAEATGQGLHSVRRRRICQAKGGKVLSVLSRGYRTSLRAGDPRHEAAKEALERNAKENFRFPPGIIPWDFDPDYKGKHLQLQFTVEDEGVFTMPWSATITYGHPLGEGVECVCAENPHEYY